MNSRWLWRTLLMPGAILLWALTVTLPSTAQESIWNLRTPEWEAVWPTMADADESRQRLIRIASELIGYSGKLLPVQPVSPVSQEPFRSGHVPIDTTLLEASDAELAYGLARGWGHVVQEHQPVVFTNTEAELAAWRDGSRFNLADEVEADIFAARFLADFGYDPQPLFAALCLRHEEGSEGQVWTDGQRVDLIADSMEDVLGLRPETPCGPDAVVILGSCLEQYDACLLTVEDGVNACHQACYSGECSSACSASSDQCNACTTSCTRRCNRSAAQNFDQCGTDQDICEEDEAP